MVKFRHVSIFIILALLPLISFAQQTTMGKEAPSLAKLVAEGKLPPLEERLPENPMVVTPVEKIGTYGGTWRTALVGGGDAAWIVRTVSYEHLVRWDPEWTKVIPNIAESYEVSPDAKEFTFYLRKGIKWSDGVPFTADDIMFWYEDILMNKEITPALSALWVSGAEKTPVLVTKIDEYTVKFTFAAPKGLFLQRFCTELGEIPVRFPKHYVQQFHAKYNSEGVDGLVKEAGVSTWAELMELKAGASASRLSNPELPRLTPWVMQNAYGEEGATRMIFERNPYYWKVDPEGNQLPYIDRVEYSLLENVEVLVLKAINGEIDMMDRHLATVPNKAVLADNREKGGYHFYKTLPTDSNYATLMLNLTHNDPVKREIFQNKKFRIGLSHAMDRQQIIDTIWVGQGEPYQSAPRPESDFYNERLARQYTEYDPELANTYLDEAGYAERDGEGFRLGPDGKRIAFTTEYNASQKEIGDALQLIQTQWKKVGIDMQVKGQDRSLLGVRTKQLGEHDAIVWVRGGGGGQAVMMDPRYYFPFVPDSMFAPAWVSWYLDPTGSAGSASGRRTPEEPPEATKKQMALYGDLNATGDAQQQVDIMKQILDISADEFYCMGIAMQGDGYGVVKNNFFNVPKSMPAAWIYPTPAPTNPEQYFIDVSAK